MRCLVCFTVLWFLLCPFPAIAGAWLRQKGETFVSLTAITRHGDPLAAREISLYADHGLGPGLSLGLDLNQRPGSSGHATLFARLPLSRPGARLKFATEAAVGGHHWQGTWHPMYRLTLSAGRGFSTRSGAWGWMAVDLSRERRFGDALPIHKLDATLGLSAPARIRPILQVETAHIAGQPLLWAVIPGLLIDAPNRRTWHIGLERKSAGHQTLGLKIGLWQRF
ncbi:hypothetical protein [Pseudodonghicola flavimaris]|uniref:Transporter n=1 Tax=Pseudodonghicola flavimaris TaxID=3050036 RepID=A0ABT7F4V9_9RHOB|nr:hypothetical protein [Pseudodonghicola flavimaris]MDK3019626.1 hypothetical protein [Pseudodonghicola flavimaris]